MSVAFGGEEKGAWVPSEYNEGNLKTVALAWRLPRQVKLEKLI
jgi:hypothetical protein